VVLENYSAGLAASRLDRAAAFRLEPNLSPDVHAAVLVPDEIVVDSWLVGAAYLHDACRVGDVTVHRDCAVTGAKPVAGGWLLETTQGEVRCAVAVNCAGNHADNVEALALGNARPGHPQRFRAVPRKGQYVVLAPPPGFHSAADLVGRPIQPLPNETTKGVSAACHVVAAAAVTHPHTHAHAHDRTHAYAGTHAPASCVPSNVGLVSRLEDSHAVML
jgi:glycerol-3-phosphate dehydrogenase